MILIKSFLELIITTPSKRTIGATLKTLWFDCGLSTDSSMERPIRVEGN